MTASFPMTDKHGGDLLVTIDDDTVRISGECGHVNISHRGIDAIMAGLTAHRFDALQSVASVDPDTDGRAMQECVKRGRENMKPEAAE